MVSSLNYRDTHVLILTLSTLWSSVLYICKRKFIKKKKAMKKRKKHIINLMITLFVVSGIISITELCNQYNYYARFIEFISFTTGFAILVITLYYYGIKLIISTDSKVVSESSVKAQNPVRGTIITYEKTDEENNEDIVINVNTDSSSII